MIFNKLITFLIFVTITVAGLLSNISIVTKTAELKNPLDGLTIEIIQKADPFVTYDENKIATLQPEASTVLTVEELSIVKKQIDWYNANIKAKDFIVLEDNKFYLKPEGYYLLTTDELIVLLDWISWFNTQDFEIPDMKSDILTQENLQSEIIEMGGCVPQSTVEWLSWGSKTTMDGCAVSEFKSNYNKASIIIGVVGAYCGWLSGGICGFLAALLAANYAFIANALEEVSGKCNSNGAIFYMAYSGLYWSVEPVC